jgi:hypothetical protein
MPEGKGYGPQNTASIGLNLNIIGEHAYAFSGTVSVDNNQTTLLDFTTGGYYVRGIYTPENQRATSGDDDYRFIVKIDGQVVSSQILSHVTGRDAFRTGVPLLFPPFSNVQVIANNATDTTANDVGALFSGKVYGKVD